MTKTQTVELLQKQLPGFYSVEQVINLINGIEDSGSTGALSEEQIVELADQIAEEVADEGMDLINDYELSMSYREVELESVDYNESTIIRAVKRSVGAYFNTLKETQTA